jgi:uncharacterized glyoxalase superfamily protein PhnB
METGATALGFAREDLAQRNGVAIRASRAADTQAAAAEIAFVTDDPDAAWRRALAAGASAVSSPARKPWGQTVACVRDLNGFLVELCTELPAP